MRINFVVQRYGPEIAGGAEAACRRFALGLSPGHEVTVLTTCASDSTSWANAFAPGESEEDGVRILRFPTVSTRGERFARLSRKLFSGKPASRDLEREWVRAQGPEVPALIEGIERSAGEPDVWVFYTYLYYPTIFGLPLLFGGPRPAVLHPALHDEPPARLPIVRDVVRKAAGLALHSNEEWALLLRFAGWPPAVTRVVGVGLEEGQGDVKAFRDKFGLGSDPYLLYLGRVDRGKGTDALARLFAAFKRANPSPLKLLIAGPLVHRPPEHEDIIVTGFLGNEERWAAFEGCEIFVHPSPYESFGIALMEAWLKSKPVLTNAASAVTAGHARRARGGLTYRDGAEFEAALEVLLGAPEQAHALGESGRRYAAEFSWDKVLDRYHNFLEKVVSP